MSYNQKNITLIDDLPTLDDLEMPKTSGLNMIPDSEVHKYQKFIRNSGHTTPPQSGMAPSTQMNSMMTPQLSPQMHHQMQQQMANPNPQMYNSPVIQDVHQNKHNTKDYVSYNLENTYNPYVAPKVYENFDNKEQNTGKKPRKSHFNSTSGHLTCIDVADHASTCSVCSRLYSNNNTLLIIFLVMSLVFNMIFIKKIVES